LIDNLVLNNIKKELNCIDSFYKVQAKPRDINIFYLVDDVRERIIKKDSNFYVNNTDLVFDEKSILSDLKLHPDRYSPNVLLRPLYQESILPNLAYIGGAGELSYWLQLQSLFDSKSVNFPMLLLRDMALVIDAKTYKKIQKYSFDKKSLFFDKDLLIRKIISSNSSKELSLKNEINILDIGSGSGGNLVGLLFALKENLPQNLNINIFTIDGNEESLKVLSKIIYKIQIKYNLNIALRSQFISFDSINGLYKDTKGYLEESYDFIMSSKMINEIIKEDVKAYYDFCNCFSKHLSKDGFLSLIDVTIKTNFKYLPIILNDQVNKFVKYNNNFKTIVLTSCNFYEEKCNKECFTNNIFYISHKEKQNDISKITDKFYRVSSNSWNNSLGIGLNIVKNILSLHKFKLEIKSIENEGSNFSIIF